MLDVVQKLGGTEPVYTCTDHNPFVTITHGEFEQRRAGPAHPVGRSPAILPVAQSTVLHPGATVVSAGPGVPRFIYARAVTKHCCAVRVWMNLKDVTYVAFNPDEGQLKSPLGTSSSTGPHQELDAMSIGADMSPGQRSGSSPSFPVGRNTGTDVSSVHWPASSPGEGPPQDDSSRGTTLPGKQQDRHGIQQEEQRWRRGTTTRGGSSLFLHYPNQAPCYSTISSSRPSSLFLHYPDQAPWLCNIDFFR